MKASRSLMTALLTAIVLSALCGAVGAQALKIGFVQDERIKTEYKAWQKAQESWDTESKAWEDEAMASQQELDDLQSDYDKQKLILSEDKKLEKEAAINTKREALDAFTRQIYGPGGTAEAKHEELIRPLLEKITKAIEAVAVEENYDVVFTLQSGLGYIKETYDITDKVLKKLDELE